MSYGCGFTWREPSFGSSVSLTLMVLFYKYACSYFVSSCIVCVESWRMTELELVEYAVGKTGYQDVSRYDAARYVGPENEYKQEVMASAYRKLLGSLKGKRILDVGCGTGRGVVDFANEAAFAVGADASLDMLTCAASKANERKFPSFSAAYTQ